MCPLPLLALKGHTLLMQFTRPVTLACRWLVWLKDLRVGEVGELSGAAASADTVRRWGLEAGVLDDVGVAVSIVVALVTPDTMTTTTTNVETNATPVAVDALSWDDSKVITLQLIGTILSNFLVEKIMQPSWFAAAWDMFIMHIRNVFLLDGHVVSVPGCTVSTVRSRLLLQPLQLQQQPWMMTASGGLWW
jgi:hypothetical protein